MNFGIICLFLRRGLCTATYTSEIVSETICSFPTAPPPKAGFASVPVLLTSTPHDDDLTFLSLGEAAVYECDEHGRFEDNYRENQVTPLRAPLGKARTTTKSIAMRDQVSITCEFEDDGGSFELVGVPTQWPKCRTSKYICTSAVKWDFFCRKCNSQKKKKSLTVYGKIGYL